MSLELRVARLLCRSAERAMTISHTCSLWRAFSLSEPLMWRDLQVRTYYYSKLIEVWTSRAPLYDKSAEINVLLRHTAYSAVPEAFEGLGGTAPSIDNLTAEFGTGSNIVSFLHHLQSLLDTESPTGVASIRNLLFVGPLTHPRLKPRAKSGTWTLDSTTSLTYAIYSLVLVS